MDKVIAYVGMATGLVGASLVATVSLAYIGFFFFLASNVAWIVNSFLTRNLPLGVMQIGFTAASLLGVYNNA